MSVVVLGYAAGVLVAMTLSFVTRGYVSLALEILYTVAILALPVVLVWPLDSPVDTFILVFCIAAELSLVSWVIYCAVQRRVEWKNALTRVQAMDYFWLNASVVVYTVLVVAERFSTSDYSEEVLVGVASLFLVAVFASYSRHIVRHKIQKGARFVLLYYGVLFAAFLSLSLLQTQRSYVLIAVEALFLCVCGVVVFCALLWIIVGAHNNAPWRWRRPCRRHS